MTQAVHRQPIETTVRAWHNHLPRWIVDHPRYDELSLAAKVVLQAIADCCDAPDGHGNLVGAIGGAPLVAATGVSRSQFWSVRKTLEDLGFITLLARGGMVRVHTRRGIVQAANVWGVPGQAGALAPVTRACVQMLRDEQGKLVRKTLAPGEQAAFWALRPATSAGPSSCAGGVVRPSDYPSPAIGLPQSGHRTLPSPIPSPNPSPDEKTTGGSAPRKNGSDEKRPAGWIRREDLTDTGKLIVVINKCVKRGWLRWCEADLVYAITSAEHALRIARTNAPGLFVTMLRNRQQRYLLITAEDEKRAVRRLRAWRTSGGELPTHCVGATT